MPQTVNMQEAKTNLSKLVDTARHGGEVIMANRGIPVARIVPIEDAGKRPLGFVPGTLSEEFFDALPDEELDAWGL